MTLFVSGMRARMRLHDWMLVMAVRIIVTACRHMLPLSIPSFRCLMMCAPEGLHRMSRVRALAADHLMQQHSKATGHSRLCQRALAAPHNSRHGQLAAAGGHITDLTADTQSHIKGRSNLYTSSAHGDGRRSSLMCTSSGAMYARVPASRSVKTSLCFLMMVFILASLFTGGLLYLCSATPVTKLPQCCLCEHQASRAMS